MQVLRTYARVYTTRLDDVVPALSSVTAQPVGMRFTMPNGLEVAAVGRVLVVAGHEEAMAAFRPTQATLVVDDLDDCQSWPFALGATIVRRPQYVPTGRNLTAALVEVVQIEYVEWDSSQWDRVNKQEG